MFETSGQAWIFFQYALIGLAVGAAYTVAFFFRGLFGKGKVADCVFDIGWWVVSAIIVAFAATAINRAQFRLYTFLGLALGFLAYIMTVQKLFAKIVQVLYNRLNKTAQKFWAWRKKVNEKQSAGRAAVKQKREKQREKATAVRTAANEKRARANAVLRQKRQAERERVQKVRAQRREVLLKQQAAERENERRLREHETAKKVKAQQEKAMLPAAPSKTRLLTEKSDREKNQWTKQQNVGLFKSRP